MLQSHLLQTFDHTFPEKRKDVFNSETFISHDRVSFSSVSISAVSGKDISPAMFVGEESSYITSLLSVVECVPSLNSDAKLFATVVAVKCEVGGGRFRGELRFQAKIDGTDPGL